MSFLILCVVFVVLLILFKGDLMGTVISMLILSSFASCVFDVDVKSVISQESIEEGKQVLEEIKENARRKLHSEEKVVDKEMPDDNLTIEEYEQATGDRIITVGKCFKDDNYGRPYIVVADTGDGHLVFKQDYGRVTVENRHTEKLVVASDCPEELTKYYKQTQKAY